MSVKAWVIGGVVATVGILGYTGYRKAKKVIGRVGEVLGVSILFDEKVAKFDAAISAIKDAKSATAALADLAELKKLGGSQIAQALCQLPEDTKAFTESIGDMCDAFAWKHQLRVSL